ncbi:MAG TPA: sigma-70 family RNA polymerase sigma factor [Verrucomicrobiae bacterium]|jgi:RNA polymerase sigma factor (sigma-70 family)
MSDTDGNLLARYTERHDEDAFTEIVRRHLDLVHSAALRQVGSSHLAEEIAQSVFIKLANQASRLTPDTILTAWLYQVTRREAIDVIRREARRQLREQIATEMNATNAASPEWTHIAPLLDEAMDTLDATDRAAVLLRYFENKSLREVGAMLGTTDDAAQKRVSRAVERLRDFFANRSITVGVTVLAGVISANAVQAAPIGLAQTISTVSVLPTTTITSAATKTIAMTTLKKSLIATATLLLCGTATVAVIKKGAASSSANKAVVAKLDNFVGRFEMTGHRLDLQKKDTGLAVFIDGQPAFVAYAQSENKFVSHDHDSITEMTFVTDAAGHATQFKLVRDGQSLGELNRTDP